MFTQIICTFLQYKYSRHINLQEMHFFPKKKPKSRKTETHFLSQKTSQKEKGIRDYWLIVLYYSQTNSWLHDFFLNNKIFLQYDLRFIQIYYWMNNQLILEFLLVNIFVKEAKKICVWHNLNVQFDDFYGMLDVNQMQVVWFSKVFVCVYYKMLCNIRPVKKLRFFLLYLNCVGFC